MKTDFHIDVNIKGVRNTCQAVIPCPHCDTDIVLNWEDIHVPDYWGDDWGTVECPVCGKDVELGDYEYD